MEKGNLSFDVFKVNTPLSFDMVPTSLPFTVMLALITGWFVKLSVMVPEFYYPGKMPAGTQINSIAV